MRFGHLILRAAVVACVVLPGPAASARVKLITLPVRQRVEIQLDHAQATLVEEERIVPLVQGLNQIDFSWANTQIDPHTIVFRVLDGNGDQKPTQEKPTQASQTEGAPLVAKVLSVSYPPNESALVWQVSSTASGSARVRISYLLGQLNKAFNYRAVVAADESSMTLRQYMRLNNLANEDFASSELWAGFGPTFLKPIGINETKEMLMARYDKIPVKKVYTCDVSTNGYLDQPKNKIRVPMHFVLQNDKSHGLGGAPLQFGKVRIFQEDRQGSTAFLGEDWGQFTPLDDEMRLFVGVAQDIVVVRTIEKNELHRVAGNLTDIEVVVKYEIENFKDKAVTLDISENLREIRNQLYRDTGRDVQWELGPGTTLGIADADKSTYEKVLFHVDLPARGADTKAAKIEHKLHLTLKHEW
jgi:hypothetical protein